MKKNTSCVALYEHGFFSTVYMASARYFRWQDMNHAWSTENLAETFQAGEILRVQTVRKYEK